MESVDSLDSVDKISKQIENISLIPIGTERLIMGHKSVLTEVKQNDGSVSLKWIGSTEYYNWDACEKCRAPKKPGFIYVHADGSALYMDRTWSVLTCYTHTENEIEKAKKKFPQNRIRIICRYND